jgi:hypothetical protein
MQALIAQHLAAQIDDSYGPYDGYLLTEPENGGGPGSLRCVAGSL